MNIYNIIYEKDGFSEIYVRLKTMRYIKQKFNNYKPERSNKEQTCKADEENKLLQLMPCKKRTIL